MAYIVRKAAVEKLTDLKLLARIAVETKTFKKIIMGVDENGRIHIIQQELLPMKNFI